MGNMTASRSGEAFGGSSDAYELFLKVYASEVLAAYEERNVMAPLVTTKTITSGKSAQFPMTGVATAGYHSPGDEITGTAINHAERVISIDNLLTSAAFIANIDEAMNHYDARAIYSREVGYALSNHMDKSLIRCAVAGSLDTTDAIGNAAGGTETTGGTGDGLVGALLDAAQTLDERDVPQGDRYAVVTPAMFYKVLKATGDTNQSGYVLNRDFGGTATPTQGGSQALMVGGIQVLMSNHIPTADEDGSGGAVDPVLGSSSVRNDPFGAEGGASGTASGYSGIDFSGYEGVVFHRSGVGMVKLLDLSVESDYLVQNQGTLMVAKLAVGSNFLRAEACIGLKNS